MRVMLGGLGRTVSVGVAGATAVTLALAGFPAASTAGEAASGATAAGVHPEVIAGSTQHRPGHDGEFSVAVSGTDIFRRHNADLLVRLERAVGLDGYDPAPPESATDDGAPDASDTFWAWDFDSGTYYETVADLRYEGDRALIYVERGRPVSQSDVDGLGTLFESRILPRTRDAFGNEPNPGVDGRAAVTLLLLDVRDSYTQGGPQYVSGYFLPVNQFRQADLDAGRTAHRSNETEMVYLDVDPTVPSGATIKQTLAHELQHLVAWNHDRDEDPWLDEALSELAVRVAGLGHPEGHVRAFLAQPGGTLTDWSGAPADYGRGYLFLLYLLERREADPTWIADLVADPQNGLASLAAALGGDDALESLYSDFAVALYHDDQDSHGGRYGFASLDLGGAYPLPAAYLVDLAAAGRHVAQAQTEVSPWSFAAFRTELGPRGLALRVTPSQATCIAAASRTHAASGQVSALEHKCVGPATAAEWSYAPATGSRDALVQAIVANTADTDLALNVEAGPSVASASHFSIVLPLIVAR